MRTIKIAAVVLLSMFGWVQISYGDFLRPPEPIDLEIVNLSYTPTGGNNYHVDIEYNENACDSITAEYVITLNVGGDVHEMVIPLGLGNFCPCMQQVDFPECNEDCVPLNAFCEHFTWSIFDYCACIFNRFATFEGIEILPGDLVTARLDGHGDLDEWFEDNNEMAFVLEPVLPEEDLDLVAIAAEAVPLGADIYDINVNFGVGSVDMGPDLVFDILLEIDNGDSYQGWLDPIPMVLCECMEQADFPECNATCAPLWPDAECDRFTRWRLDYCYCYFGDWFNFPGLYIPEGSLVTITLESEGLISEWDEENNTLSFLVEGTSVEHRTWSTIKNIYD